MGPLGKNSSFSGLAHNQHGGVYSPVVTGGTNGVSMNLSSTHGCSQILVEDFDENIDGKFIKDSLIPYLRDLYRDLALRSFVSTGQSNTRERRLDKVTFVQYTNLPGIISERLLKMFDSNNDGMITEQSFISQMTKIFVSDLDTRMRVTFQV